MLSIKLLNLFSIEQRDCKENIQTFISYQWQLDIIHLYFSKQRKF